MSSSKMVLYVLVMCLITYLIRVVPMAFFRKKIKSVYLQSLFYYLPYAVLSSMTFPYIFYSTQNFISALVGTVVALIASISKRSLIVVALLSCGFVLLTELILPFFI